MTSPPHTHTQRAAINKEEDERKREKKEKREKRERRERGERERQRRKETGWEASV